MMNVEREKSKDPVRGRRKRWVAYASATSAALASSSAYSDVVLINPSCLVPLTPAMSPADCDLDGDSNDDVQLALNIATSNLTQSAQLDFLVPATSLTSSNNFNGGGVLSLSSVTNSGNRTATTMPFLNAGALPTASSKTFALVTTGGLNAWIRVKLDTLPNGQYDTLSITGGAYEDEGNPIHVGSVPEPSSFALLGLLASVGGVAALKKRRNQKSTS